MNEELRRHDWARLRTATGMATEVPKTLAALAAAPDRDAASRSYWMLDNEVVVQGTLYQAAPATAASAVALAPSCTDAARPFLFELLAQLGGGATVPADAAQRHDQTASCRDELLLGFALFLDGLVSDDTAVQLWSVDLLGMCAERAPALRERVVWHLKRYASSTIVADNRVAAENWLNALGKDEM